MASVLITGGAGFIGGHLARELLRAGHRVRALDNLSPQVHGPERRRPPWLDDEVQLVQGDLRDGEAVRRALDGVEVVFHLAAQAGAGQSMHRIGEYISVNTMGTATLLETLAVRPVERLIVASSMSVYGEGWYRDADERVVPGSERRLAELARGVWELRGLSGEPLNPIPTSERKPVSLASVYAVSKHDQERLCLLTARAYGFVATALRLFNVYGPHQALANPYAGALACFAARLLGGRPPLVFEDGRQRRDFVSVHDVARAFRLAMESDDCDGQVINVGSGQSHTVVEVARRMAEVMGAHELHPVVTGKYRMGDVRHCFADISAARVLLGYRPAVGLDEGLRELAGWLAGQAPPIVDRAGEAQHEPVAEGPR
jgi:dTDP-L-rhamnose 4-epimerase